jgi:ribonuclease P protein component
MLRTRREFERLQAGGRSRAHRLLVVRVRPNDLDHDRFGISTGRRLGNAVERNRVRRRIRETLRVMAHTTGDGRDVLIVARAAGLRASHQELRAALEGLLGSVRAREAASGP